MLSRTSSIGAPASHSGPRQTGGADAPIASPPISSGPFETEGRRPQPLNPWATNGGPGPHDTGRDTLSCGGGQSERGSVKDADAGLSPALSKPWGNQPICPGCNRGQWASCLCDPFFDDGDSAAEHRVAESLRQIDWCRQGRGKPDGFERVEF